MKRKKRKNTKKNKKKNKITKKDNKKELEVILKTLKNIKVSKQINRLKGIKLLPKKKINKIINRQVNLLKKLSPRNLANITSESLNAFYENFKKQQKIRKLKRKSIKKNLK